MSDWVLIVRFSSEHANTQMTKCSCHIHIRVRVARCSCCVASKKRQHDGAPAWVGPEPACDVINAAFHNNPGVAFCCVLPEFLPCHNHNSLMPATSMLAIVRCNMNLLFPALRQRCCCWAWRWWSVCNAR